MVGDFARKAGISEAALKNLAPRARLMRTVLKSEVLHLLSTTPVDLILAVSGPLLLATEDLARAMNSLPLPIPILVVSQTRERDHDRPHRPGEVVEHMCAPVEVLELQARVNALLAARAQLIRIEGVSLPGFVQLVEMERRSCTLFVASAERRGVLSFIDGKLVDAHSPERDGEAAALEIFGWGDAIFAFHRTVAASASTVRRSLTELLLESARLRDEDSRAPPRSHDAPPSEFDFSEEIFEPPANGPIRREPSGAQQAAESSDTPHADESRDPSPDAPHAADSRDTLQATESSDTPHAADSRDPSPDAPHAADSSDTLQTDESSDTPHAAESSDTLQATEKSDTPHAVDSRDPSPDAPHAVDSRDPSPDAPHATESRHEPPAAQHAADALQAAPSTGVPVDAPPPTSPEPPQQIVTSLSEEPSPPAPQVRAQDPPRPTPDPRHNATAQITDSEREIGELTMANINKTIEEAMRIDGAIGVALADYESGLCLGMGGGGSRLNIEVAAAGNCSVVKAKMNTMHELGIRGAIQDILITLDDQIHLIRPLKKYDNLFIYLAVDKTKGNLGMARHRLQKIESELVL